jgi:uroporphyrin-III C-methyltransferase
VTGNRRYGLVSLVGAGLGDPDLLTVGGLRRLRLCDVVVYDRLIDPRMLAVVPEEAERIFAGKAAGSAALEQEAIEDVLILRARQGKSVVRLKGGDPFLFGRGAEEVEALAAAGIPWEVVPGVTSAVAAPASAGIPVTHRDLSSQVTIVTGHEDPLKPESQVDWSWLAASPGTIVILMGLGRLEHICAQLMINGKDVQTPAAVISAGTLPQQHTVSAPLGDLFEAARAAEVGLPAIIVIGDVAAFPAQLAAAATAALPYAI